jgi:hypothetical protein
MRNPFKKPVVKPSPIQTLGGVIATGFLLQVGMGLAGLCGDIISDSLEKYRANRALKAETLRQAQASNFAQPRANG